MSSSFLLRYVGLSMLSFALVACSSSPTGRNQLVLVPEDQLNQMGAQSFEQIKSETPKSDNEILTQHVQCVADRIISVLPDKYKQQAWEVILFDDPQINAFALPGNKIGVYTGLLEVAENQSQLAAVVGHEVGHVLARHGNERVSTQLATSQALALGYQLSGEDSAVKTAVFQGLGIGAQFGILLPFSRAHETEADLIGLDLMAKAGFNPRESAELWRNMSKTGSSSTPEWMSTHPSNNTRINTLESSMDEPYRIYSVLKSNNNTAKCY
ncbi:M48 family peptidase [Marinomonas piezotolerans]|uniref:M48 family peptidase n=1 Tax=Marinomonas piezotolerans TaxID=2213058 RepID=A0A370UD74_9GAMM|nr:M48 family metallopeptidase [Marinomonas piezotolerans]RDL45747.1 M48 family peptidase [Marinomonas piezotolerans]